MQCLDTGADDFLPKPFSFSELSARIRALLRRSHLPSESVLVVEDLKLDRVEHRAERAGRRIELTAKEFSLLEYLMRNAGRQVSRAMIIEHVWNLTFDTTTNVVDVYINYLRRKVDDGHPRKLIHTVRGVGYEAGQRGGSAGMIPTWSVRRSARCTKAGPDAPSLSQRAARSHAGAARLAQLLHALNQPLTGLQCSMEVALAGPRTLEQYVQGLREGLVLTERMRALVEAIREVADVEAELRRRGRTAGARRRPSWKSSAGNGGRSRAGGRGEERSPHAGCSSAAIFDSRRIFVWLTEPEAAAAGALMFRLLDSALSLAEWGTALRIEAGMRIKVRSGTNSNRVARQSVTVRSLPAGTGIVGGASGDGTSGSRAGSGSGTKTWRR